MISESQYNQLLSHKEDIIKFMSTKRLRNSELLTITDHIRQAHGLGSINYGCDGCKIQALTDIYHMFNEYETANFLR